MAVLWLMGGLLVLFGSIMGGSIDPTDCPQSSCGVAYYMAYVVAFVLILMGGFLWITVAAAAREHL